MDAVLGVLVVFLIGGLGAMFVVPPFLEKIDRTGQVDFFGIKFPPKL